MVKMTVVGEVKVTKYDILFFLCFFPLQRLGAA
jgi:hypothetical protein